MLEPEDGVLLQRRLMRAVYLCVCAVIVFISFWETLRFPRAKKLIFPHFWHTIPHLDWSLLVLWEEPRTVPSGGHPSTERLCDAALKYATISPPLCSVFPTFVSGRGDIWAPPAGADKTGVILPPHSPASENDKWTYSSLLIAGFYGITSLQPFRI